MPTRKSKVRSPRAERIFLLRKQLGLDQKGFAIQLNVDQGTVSKWENDQTVPGPNTYIRLAELASGNLRKQLLADGGVSYDIGNASVAHREPSDKSSSYDGLSTPNEEAFERPRATPKVRVTRPEPTPATSGQWDPELLVFVIEAVDQELKKRGRKIPTRKFAEMVVVFYQFCQQSGRKDAEMLGRLLMIA